MGALSDIQGLRPRIHSIDTARTIALIGMVIFHTARDLEIFGVLAPGTTLSGGWAIFARLIAGCFFFLAGVSLVLGHGHRIRWQAFWRRLATLVIAALAVSVATYAVMPGRFIYFGILHSIAACSLIGLAFLRLPAALIIVASGGVFALNLSGFHPLPSTIWSFTGLSVQVRPSFDLSPIVPWLGAMLLGIGCAKIWTPAPAGTNTEPHWLGWPGRHSLAVYLLHQPALIAVIWLILKVT